MLKVLVLVEGQSEERFVKDLLSAHLSLRGVFMIPKIVSTKVVKAGPNFRGGLNSFGQLSRDLKLLLQDSSAKCITTLIDLYAIPSDFPGFAEANTSKTVDARLAILRKRLSERFPDKRFLPYFSTHEFEALTLISAKPFFEIVPPPHNKSLLTTLCATDEPETINGTNPPGKRIIEALPGYRKTLHGPTVAREHGLAAIRKKCSRFDMWLKYLEDLAR